MTVMADEFCTRVGLGFGFLGLSLAILCIDFACLGVLGLAPGCFLGFGPSIYSISKSPKHIAYIQARNPV